MAFPFADGMLRFNFAYLKATRNAP